jgi:hypothetical protein
MLEAISPGMSPRERAQLIEQLQEARQTDLKNAMIRAPLMRATMSEPPVTRTVPIEALSLVALVSRGL